MNHIPADMPMCGPRGLVMSMVGFTWAWARVLYGRIDGLSMGNYDRPQLGFLWVLYGRIDGLSMGYLL